MFTQQLLLEKAETQLYDSLIDRANANIEKIHSPYRQTVSISSLGVKNFSRFRKDLIEYLQSNLSDIDKQNLTFIGIIFKDFANAGIIDNIVNQIDEISQSEAVT